MANKVGLKETEYEALENGVKNCHNDSLSQIENVLEKLGTLNTKGGGLYIKELTPKVDAVIKELESIKSNIEEVYTAHETVIKSYRTTIANYDTEL
jgi:hypothetical protein